MATLMNDSVLNKAHMGSVFKLEFLKFIVFIVYTTVKRESASIICMFWRVVGSIHDVLWISI